MASPTRNPGGDAAVLIGDGQSKDDRASPHTHPGARCRSASRRRPGPPARSAGAALAGGRSDRRAAIHHPAERSRPRGPRRPSARTAGDPSGRVLPGSGVGAVGGVAASPCRRPPRSPGDLAISVDLRSRLGERPVRDRRGCTRGRVPGSPHPRPVRRGRSRSRTARRDERVAGAVVGVRQPHHRSRARASSLRVSRAFAPRRPDDHPSHRHPTRRGERQGKG